MAQPWRWERDQQFATTAYAEYDDGVGGRSLQDEEEEEEDLSLIICEIPTAGCKNGMYNVKKCKCEVGVLQSYSFSTFLGRRRKQEEPEEGRNREWRAAVPSAGDSSSGELRVDFFGTAEERLTYLVQLLGTRQSACQGRPDSTRLPLATI